MRKVLKPIIAFFLIALVAAPAWADEYTDAIAAFKKAGESSDFFRTAYGYAVFPTIVKGALSSAARWPSGAAQRPAGRSADR